MKRVRNLVVALILAVSALTVSAPRASAGPLTPMPTPPGNACGWVYGITLVQAPPYGIWVPFITTTWECGLVG
jgi:hypothetical protein